MLLKKTHVVLAVAVLTAVAVFSPTACQAGLFDCFNTSSSPAPTTYAPPYQAQRVAWMPTGDACNPCAAPQVNYVPETQYRWKYSRIERTEYQPVAACDPCSGCPTTSYRPVTKKSLLPWLHREAYTTYKAVPYGGATPVSYMQPSSCNPCATSCDPCGSACGPCGVGSMSAPSLGSGCSSCVAGTQAYTDSAASDPGYTGQTFRSERSPSEWAPIDSDREEVLKPAPDPETEKSDEEAKGTTTAMPKLVIPQFGPDRTARVSRVRTVSYDEPASLSMSGNLYQAATVVIPLRLVPVE
jgi:hypothetical protein